MSKRKAVQSLNNLERALKRLEEALNEDDSNSLYVDGTIHRFEFAVELYWKTLKRLLEEEGIQTKTPREALKQAFMIRWINDEQRWLQMLRDRNATSYIYNEKRANEIYKNIVDYFPEMKKTFECLQVRIINEEVENND